LTPFSPITGKIQVPDFIVPKIPRKHGGLSVIFSTDFFDGLSETTLQQLNNGARAAAGRNYGSSTVYPNLLNSFVNLGKAGLAVTLFLRNTRTDATRAPRSF